MAENYGKRLVDMPTPEQVRQAAAFAGTEIPDEIPMEYDFSELRNHPMLLKLDIGASSYYSEIASIQTLDNLLRENRIDVVQYLERLPDGYVPARRELIQELKRQREQMMQMQTQMPAPEQPMPGAASDGAIAEIGGKPEIPTGGGFSALQRKVLETGDTRGIV